MQLKSIRVAHRPDQTRPWQVEVLTDDAADYAPVIGLAHTTSAETIRAACHLAASTRAPLLASSLPAPLLAFH